MRHRVAGNKLKRRVGHRKALIRNLITAVIENDFIITTVPKAKAVKPLVEKMVTLGKDGSLAARRQAATVLQTPDSLKRLFDKVAPKFGQRQGGYTRITRIGPRQGDGAELCKLELVGTELIKRAAERAKRREERLKQEQEGGEAPPQQ
jgi:large subunit ribosomal protein L17